MPVTTDTYSGQWKRTVGFYNLPSPLHVADPAHNQPGVTEGENAYTYTSTSALPLEGEESWGSGYVLADMSRPFDATPVDHTVGSTAADVEITRLQDLDQPGGNEADWIAHSRAEHYVDYGATTAQNYGEPSFQFADEQYHGAYTPGPGPEYAEAIPALAGGGQRGLNGLAVNSPPLDSYDGKGFRYGHVHKWGVDRKFAARIIQRHDMKALFDNVAYAPVDQPAGSPDSSTFSLFARTIRNIQQRPQLRRTPELSSSAVTYDGTGEESAAIGDGF